MEIGKIMVQGSLGKKVSEMPISINKLGVVAHTYHYSYVKGHG
jgi:hypothetical protein